MQNDGIAGIGCSLIDYLYPDVDFDDPGIRSYFSTTALDGGLIPGGLVFVDELEKYADTPIAAILARITKDKNPGMVNLGGPAIVALINCAQLLTPLPVEVRYYGRMGNDVTADYIKNILKKTPLAWSDYLQVDGATPGTYVFSDPKHDNGRGERMFVNNIGIAGAYTVHDIPDHFFDSRILLFGATALLPGIHDTLGVLLKKGKTRGCVNIVTTVYDFRNAKKNPGGRWPMGDDDGNYRLIDLLIADYDEALHLSNASSIDDAINFFIEKQTPAFIITHGPDPVYLYSSGNIFRKTGLTTLPVSAYVSHRLKNRNGIIGDTTGCGDNFAGGVLSSIAYQLFAMKSETVDLITACAWGMASGGFTCFYLGGTYLEEHPGEKRDKIQFVFNEYREQMKNRLTFIHDDFSRD